MKAKRDRSGSHDPAARSSASVILKRWHSLELFLMALIVVRVPFLIA